MKINCFHFEYRTTTRRDARAMGVVSTSITVGHPAISP
jgi:hypothetical protein